MNLFLQWVMLSCTVLALCLVHLNSSFNFSPLLCLIYSGFSWAWFPCNIVRSLRILNKQFITLDYLLVSALFIGLLKFLICSTPFYLCRLNFVFWPIYWVQHGPCFVFLVYKFLDNNRNNYSYFTLSRGLHMVLTLFFRVYKFLDNNKSNWFK